MSKKRENKNKSFFIARANELRCLHDCLNKLFPEHNYRLDPLISAAKELEEKANGETTLDEWGYTINDLTLPVGEIRNTEPSGMRFRVNLGCKCKAKVADYEKKCDPFIDYSFYLYVIGDFDDKSYTWGMHMEKDKSIESSEWHPLYHIHCFDGRKEMRHALYDAGQRRGMPYLNVPRLAHYPLDLVLGIGFCLMNFHDKSIFEKLYKDNKVFPRLYMSSQKRILEPYYNAITNTGGVAGTGWAGRKELCPQIV